MSMVYRLQQHNIIEVGKEQTLHYIFKLTCHLIHATGDATYIVSKNLMIRLIIKNLFLLLFKYYVTIIHTHTFNGLFSRTA